jgi:hypothetical protein
MKTLVGDIWELSTREDLIVVTVNVGWTRVGKAVMGRGIAREATRRWPKVAWSWGKVCQEHGAKAPPSLFATPGSKWCKGLILFPTKPLNSREPWLSWRQDSSYELIEFWLPWLNNAVELMAAEMPPVARVLVPTLGCGCGNLDPDRMTMMLEEHLTHERFVHVRYR